MQISFGRVVYLPTFVLLVLVHMAHATITLGPTTNIVIQTRGNLQNSAELTSDLLARHLQAALRRDTLEADGQTVTFILEAEAATWDDLVGKVDRLTEIDQYEIQITDQPATVRLFGRTAKACSYAVTDFLETELGIGWFMPGELGLCLPNEKKFTLKAVKRTVEPAVASRVYTGLQMNNPALGRFGYEGLTQDHRYYFKSHDAIKAYRLRHLSFASHALVRVFPVEEFGQSDPDIYPLIDGERFVPPKDKQNWHLCFTNPKIVDIAVKKARAYFAAKRGQTFSLGINDGVKWKCECEPCRKVGIAQGYFDFVTKVADRIRKDHPLPYMIGMLAYGDVGLPTENLKLPDNVLVLNGQTFFEGHASNLGAYEYLYGWGFWVPNFPLQSMKSNALRYRELGVMSLHAEVHPIWAFDAPKVHIRSKLLWNPDLDVDAELATFCERAFGKGGPAMTRMYQRWAAITDKHIPQNDPKPMVDIYAFRRSETQFSRVSQSDYEFAANCLAEAKQAEADPLVQKRLAMVEAFNNHSQVLFNMWQNKQDVFASRGKMDQLLRRTESLAEDRAESLVTMREHAEWFTGTVQKVDRILSPMWIGRWEWTLDYEQECAQRTARLALQDNVNTKPMTLGEFDVYHKQYNQSQYATMQVENVGNTTRFAASGNEHNRYLRGSFPIKQGEQYIADFDITATDGELVIMLHNMNVCGKTVAVTELFDKQTNAIKRRIALKPVPTWGDNRAVRVIDVELLWKPNTADARIEGAGQFAHVLQGAPAPAPKPKPTTQPAAKNKQPKQRMIVTWAGETDVRNRHDPEQAAKMFAGYLKKATGQAIPVFAFADAPPAEQTFLITHASQVSEGIQKKFEGKERDAFLIREPYNHEGRDVCLLVSADPYACDYPAYQFLREHLNIEWVGPGELGEVIPESPNWQLPASIDKLYNPDFAMRLWADRGVQNARPLLAGSGRMGFHHALGTIFHPDKHGDTPEVYPLVDGKRYIPTEREGHRIQSGWQPCVAHPKSIEIATEHCLKALESGKSISASLSVNDGAGNTCECDLCMKLDPDLGERLWKFYNIVTEKVVEQNPDAYIAVLAYGPSQQPPTKTRIHDRIVVFVTGGDPTRFGDVGGKRAVYHYHLDNAYPTVRHYPTYLADYVDTIYKEGATAMYTQIEHSWAAGGPKVFLLANMLWDVDTDVDATLDRYLRLTFGEAAAPHIRRYFDQWETIFERENRENKYSAIDEWNSNHLRKHEQVTWQDIADLSSALEQAGKADITPKQAQRLEYFRKYYLWAEANLKQYLMARDLQTAAWLSDRKPEQILHYAGQALQLTGEFDRRWERDIAADRTGWLLNHKMFKHVEQGKRFYDSLLVGPIRTTVEGYLAQGIEAALEHIAQHDKAYTDTLAAIAAKHTELQPYVGPFLDRKNNVQRPNLLTNGSFEEGELVDGEAPRIPGWWFYDRVGMVKGAKANYAWNSESSEDGSKALGFGEGKYPGVRAFVFLEAGRYDLSFKYRTVNREKPITVNLLRMVPKYQSHDFQTLERVREISAINDSFIKFLPQRFGQTDGNWQQVSSSVQVNKAGMYCLMLEPFFMEKDAWAWFDDVSLKLIWSEQGDAR